MKSRRSACVAVLAWSACSSAPEHAKSNFVVILADDLRYGDVPAYGSVRSATPHLDRMAREGLRFSDFHSNGPICRPTRASLPTGPYPQRFGRNFESTLSGVKDYDSGLPLDAVTIPRYFLAQAMSQACTASGIWATTHPTCRWIRVSTTFGGWRAVMAITTLTSTDQVALTGGTTKNSLLRRAMVSV